jgi:hypothetical protein
MSETVIDNRHSIFRQTTISEKHLKAGSIKGKIEVRIDDRTVIYVKPGKDIEAIKEKYQKATGIFHYLDQSGNVNTKDNKPFHKPRKNLLKP